MAGSKVNSYSLGDSDPFAFTTLMESVTWQRKGFMGIVLTNYNNDGLPAIAAGSTVEIGGALFKFASEEVISLTDPDTSSAVADGVTYIRLIPAGSAVTAAFTATAPTWDDSKVGYYGTGGSAGNRYITYLKQKSGPLYAGKRIYQTQDTRPYDHVRAYVNSGATPAASGLIPYDTITHDELGNYVTGTKRFVASESGYFKVYAQIKATLPVPVGGTGATLGIGIAVNGSSVAFGQNEIDTTYAVTSFIYTSVSDVVFLDTGDYIDCNWSSTESVAPITGTQNSFITIDRMPY